MRLQIQIILGLCLFLLSLNSFAKMTIYFLDVGQGDSEYIELPNGKNVLIDGGPSKKALIAFLKEKNITKIDYMILSHPHSDHYAGLEWVIDNLKVENFYDSNLVGSASVQAFRAKVATKTTVHYPQIGEELSFDEEVKTKVYNNCVGSTISEKNPNNCSLVVKMTHNNQSSLFMGDVEKAAISKMLKSWASELEADVIKVAHHGSATGTTQELLSAVHPKEAFIEVGAGNNYGHPTSVVLDLLQGAGAKVFRSDTDGTSIVEFN